MYVRKMSSSMRNFMEAYSAVHNTEAREELSSGRDHISEMDLSHLTSDDLDEIAEQVLEVVFETLTVKEAHEVITSVFDVETGIEGRAHKVDRLSEAFNKTFAEVGTKAAPVALEHFAQYRHNKKLQETWTARFNQEKRVARVHGRLVAEEVSSVRARLLTMIDEKKAQKCWDTHNKVSSRMSEGTVRKDVGDIYQAIYEKKAAKDYDGDGEVESGKDEYFGSKDKAIKKAMGKKGKCEKCGKDPCECDKDVSEAIDAKGAARMDAAKGNKKETQDARNRRLMLGKYSPAVKYGKMKKEEVQQVDEGKLKAAAGSVLGGVGGGVVGGLVGGPVGATVGAAAGRSAGAALGAKKGRKKEAAVGGLVAGPVGAAIASEYTPKGITFSEAELKAIQAKVDGWDVEEGYQRNPEKGEAKAKKYETAETKVRGRLNTMDPDKAAEMKKQMRAVGLNV